MVQMDHQALKYMDKMRNATGRPTDFDVLYRPGNINGNADGVETTGASGAIGRCCSGS